MTAMDERGDPRQQRGAGTLQTLGVPGTDDDLRRDLDERITEFESRHQQDVLHGGEGWVPRIRRIDYAVAIAVNALIVLWLIVVLMGGE